VWSATKLDGFDFEVESNKRKDEALEILNQVVEASKTVRIPTAVDVDQGADLGGGEGDVFVADDDLELLASHPIRSWPQGVVLGHDFRVLDDPAQLLHDGLVYKSLLPDHGVVLVVGVVGVAQLAVRTKLKLKKFVPEFSLVTHIVAQIKVVFRHLEPVGDPNLRRNYGLLLDPVVL